MNVQSNGRIRRSAAEWREILDRFNGSGLSARKFCQQESIGEASFLRWRRKLEAAPPARPKEFVEVASSTDAFPAFWSVEIELPDGRMLRIRG